MNKPRPWIERRLFALAVLALAISGLGQMPIFKRYYIADIPGLAWTADFYVTHIIHYLAAAVFLALVALRAGEALASRRLGRISHLRMTRLHWAQLAAIAGLVLTGFIRVWKNLPTGGVSKGTGMAVDIGHLVLAMAWGGLALASWIIRRRSAGRLAP
ncbi:hypothetical protein [Megalodesulfovibrio gigas]|uniref:Iron-sulfur cluster-binding protein n=1 Tax=Megalodesulfovibrio gigas (strain ATCC 19364 / DSM 1382 / NCIMB 9332 / VKM B-1759) TaxID=1121448 RepID=T2G8R3_MEGG1|nr:hypothetical protein [Megalodesulfovibrio gigas]AGW12297.1 hypothetical protein DGI_0376 [Megalodesulfovibrio gigas DSM 1382 = ATCC 19364]